MPAKLGRNAAQGAEDAHRIAELRRENHDEADVSRLSEHGLRQARAEREEAQRGVEDAERHVRAMLRRMNARRPAMTERRLKRPPTRLRARRWPTGPATHPSPVAAPASRRATSARHCAPVRPGEAGVTNSTDVAATRTAISVDAGKQTWSRSMPLNASWVHGTALAVRDSRKPRSCRLFRLGGRYGGETWQEQLVSRPFAYASNHQQRENTPAQGFLAVLDRPGSIRNVHVYDGSSKIQSQ